jgi:hypothetical protein
MEAQRPTFEDETRQAHHYLGLLRDGTAEQRIEARMALGLIFERRGQFEEAAELYENNIWDGVRDPSLYDRLAMMYRRTGRVDLAQEVDAEALRLREARVYRGGRAAHGPNGGAQ